MRKLPALLAVAALLGSQAACDDTDVPNRGDAAPGQEIEAEGANVEVEPVDLESQRWFRESGTVEFDGRNWILTGEPIYDPAVERVGEYEGTPLYAEVNTAQPYSELFIPLENDMWQMVVPGTATGQDTLEAAESRGVPGIDPVGDPTGSGGGG